MSTFGGTGGFDNSFVISFVTGTLSCLTCVILIDYSFSLPSVAYGTSAIKLLALFDLIFSRTSSCFFCTWTHS